MLAELLTNAHGLFIGDLRSPFPHSHRGLKFLISFQSRILSLSMYNNTYIPLVLTAVPKTGIVGERILC